MPTHCRQQCCPRIMQAKEPTLMCDHALHSQFSHFQLLLVAAEKTLLLRGGGGELPRVFWLNKSKGLFSLLFWMLGSHLFVYEPRNQRSLGQQDQ